MGGSAWSALLTLLPALVVLAVMFTRPYAGERTINRLRESRRGSRPSRTRRAASWLATRQPERIVAARTQLLACSLAGRAPPLRLAASL